jgi:FkbM family methyltransferase
MFSLSHFRRICSSARALHLTLPDTGRWIWSYYASRLAGTETRGPGVSVISLRDSFGGQHELCLRNNGYDWTVVEEIFLHHLYRVDLEGVKNILDLGGNIGLASLSFAQQYPGAQVCAVEPIPDNLAVLKRNVERNRAAVRIVPGAVGNSDGRARFTISADPRQHSTVIEVLPTNRTVDVEVFSIPSLMKLMGWMHIDLLKIDIEGGEKDILGGQPSWLNNVRCIVGEGHVGVGYDIEACRRDLEPMGFSVKETYRTEGAAMVFHAYRRDAE